MKVLTNMTIRNLRFQGEVNSSPSLTVPDQAISPQELLRRYATGQPLGLKNVEAVYDESGDIPEFFKMDKLDRLHMLQDVAEKRVDLMELFNKEQNEARLKREKFEENEKAKRDENERKTTNSEAKNDE